MTTHTHTHTYTYTLMCTLYESRQHCLIYKSVYLYVYMYVNVCVCVYVCLRVCVWVCPQRGATPLMFAAYSPHLSHTNTNSLSPSHTNTMKLLLQLGADVHTADAVCQHTYRHTSTHTHAVMRTCGSCSCAF